MHKITNRLYSAVFISPSLILTKLKIVKPLHIWLEVFICLQKSLRPAPAQK
jgi:hypothetical protein